MSASEVKGPALSEVIGGLADVLSVGHSPSGALKPQDETLFRAFQSNLLSLISHELRTPLMGILNALGMLDEGLTTSELSEAELIAMARQNAQRLSHALSSLLDLASLDSGTFKARLREVDLSKLVQSRYQARRSLFRDRKLEVKEVLEAGAGVKPVLADAQRLGRAVELCLHVVASRAEMESKVVLRLTSTSMELEFVLTSGMEGHWESAWSQALAGHQGGVASPSSAFAGVMQSEQAFLTRMEEGLGSELMLVHEIARLHLGKFESQRMDRKVSLKLSFPELDSEEALQAVLASRAYQVSTELGSVALVLIRVPETAQRAAWLTEIRRSLFRASDAVYELPKRGQIALVLDDCKPEDAPRLMERIKARLGRDVAFGAAQCPVDGLDPAMLLPLAEKRLSGRK